MRISQLAILVFMGLFSTLAIANNQIEFRNTTNYTVSVKNPMASDGLITCYENQLNRCIKNIEDIILLPNESKNIAIESAVTNASARQHMGTLGFEIAQLKTNATIGLLKIPALAIPNEVAVLSNTDYASAYAAFAITYAKNQSPGFFIAISQNIGEARDITAVNKTIVVIGAIN